MSSSQWSYKLFEITTTVGQKITGIFKQPKQPASSIQFVYEDQLEMFPETSAKLNGCDIATTTGTVHTHIGPINPGRGVECDVEVGDTRKSRVLRIYQYGVVSADLVTACQDYLCEGIIFEFSLPGYPTPQEIGNLGNEKYKIKSTIVPGLPHFKIILWR